IIGVNLFDSLQKQPKQVYADIVVNAAGIWGQHIASMAEVPLKMFPAKGALLIMGHRLNQLVINRCRKPADADILVPGDTVSVIGTTSSHIDYDQIDNMKVTPEEVDILLAEGQKLAPALASTRILRAYAGVRPLVAADDDPTGRNISRGIVCLDHAVRDGLEGFVTITGGKLMTYRLMAEMATDMVCQKLKHEAKCRTAELLLPGSEKVLESDEEKKDSDAKKHTSHKAARGRHGSLSDQIPEKNEYDNALICECEAVSVGEVNYAIEKLHTYDLSSLRRRTRVGMGTCQGELCACRAAGLLANSHSCTDRAKDDLKSFLNERWKGVYPVAWDQTLSESYYTAWIYEGVCGLK
ncbi:MAG: anaerobic glycerol-3-phosphate dehydrogenase subunit A, partial [Bacteroidales bacterium]